MSDSAAPSTPAQDEPIIVSTLFGNSGSVRLWLLVVRIFLFFGLLGVLDRAWWTLPEIEARFSWPSANGRIVSANQVDDKDNPALRSGSLSQHTDYWVEYEVAFAVPDSQCMTGILYGGPSEDMPCHGIVHTRRTKSTAQVFQWYSTGYAPNAPVTVLHNPHGPQVRIAGSSLWTFYAWPETLGTLVWVIAFSIFHVFLQRRYKYFRSHPEAEALPPSDPPDKNGLTSLDLS